MRRAALRVLIAALAICVRQPAVADPRAVTSAGVLEGVESKGVAVFRGVPYAAAPVGEARWRSPRPFPHWNGVRQAKSFGHNCFQELTPQGFGPWTHEYVVQADVSEDCLFLNIWRPAGEAARLPVLVWIHGGGFVAGSGAVDIYDGAALARNGIVVVTLNYRLGIFGFFSHPELTRQAAGQPAANFGLQDVLAALEWVQANIAAFGGDPKAVTLAGQSAGSMAVQFLLAAPRAQGLFQRAIGQSGLPFPLGPLSKAEEQGAVLGRKSGRATLAKLRAVPPEALQEEGKSIGLEYLPVADGVLLPQGPWRAASDVPMLVGLTADEGSMIGEDYGSPDRAKLRELIRTRFGAAMASRVAALYPAGSPAERARANKEIWRDSGLGALYAWVGQRAVTARTPVYAYLFTREEPGAHAQQWGAFHSCEVPYIFQTFAASPERPFTATDRLLSQRSAALWAQFIKTGDPDSSGLPAWPRLTLEQPQILQIGATIRAQPLLPPDKLDLARDSVAAGGALRIF